MTGTKTTDASAELVRFALERRPVPPTIIRGVAALFVTEEVTPTGDGGWHAAAAALRWLRPGTGDADPVGAAFLDAARQAAARWSADDVADVVVAAARTLAGTHRRAEDDLLEAIARGLEVARRLGQVLVEAHREGWAPAGTIGPVAAAVAGARLAGLTRDQARHAIGLAATQGAGLRVAEDSDAGPILAGAAAAAAVEAVGLAGIGFTGPPNGVDGRRGLIRTVAGDVPLDALTSGLGERWLIEADLPEGHGPQLR